jgi:hypothetical protein
VVPAYSSKPGISAGKTGKDGEVLRKKKDGGVHFNQNMVIAIIVEKKGLITSYNLAIQSNMVEQIGLSPA